MEKPMIKSAPNSPCGGDKCSYNLNIQKDEINCDVGTGSCFNAKFLSADISPFHGQDIQDATDQINKIISGITPKKGYELSLLNTNMGLLLAWVSHDGTTSPDDITSENTDAEIKAAFRIK